MRAREISESPPSKYVGSAWRSRFLRAPKIALTLGLRNDFVYLQTLAIAKLGLKTGADDFFFLRRGDQEKREPNLVKERPHVLCFGKDGWAGELTALDLKPAISNPHEFFDHGRRRFKVRKRTNYLYLMPRKGRASGSLPDYIRLGELAGVHQKTLVLANAQDGVWYRQARTLVSSPWALPYNSAYDYGAWDNSVGAVLNGRFVGVEPLPGIDCDLLGAALNSTFAMIGRLTEGVATGVEGALDVGPPSVRRIVVPDIRRIRGEGKASVVEIMSEIRRADTMPEAPSRDNIVPTLRRRLDCALLESMGNSKGDSVVLMEQIYAGYARWRADIEDVEAKMQSNRRQMGRSGLSRSVKPAEAVGRRVWEELKAETSLYPTKYLPPDEPLEIVKLPPGAMLQEDEPLFDQAIVRGKGGAKIDLKSFDRVRYASMLRTIGLRDEMPIPTDAARARFISNKFSQDRVKFCAQARERALSYLGDKEAVADAVAVAERQWLNSCRASMIWTSVEH
jgi:hypothetical protein